MPRVTEENVGAFILGALESPRADALGDQLEASLGIIPKHEERRVVNALVALRLGITPGTVARYLGWRDFERFCALLFRSRGYEVRENLTLRKPRAQIDLVALGPSYAICVDCKHWKKGHSPATLARMALAQKRRSKLLGRVLPEKPILSAILSLSASSGDFVEGVAVVPIGSVTGFLHDIDIHIDRFDVVEPEPRIR